MIWSQMTASLTALAASTSDEVLVDGHEAVIYTKTCFVFQVNRLDRSASRLNRICAYSSFLVL